jgi:hypothetical protein
MKKEKTRKEKRRRNREFVPPRTCHTPPFLEKKNKRKLKYKKNKKRGKKN